MEIAFICQSASHSSDRPFGQGGTDSQIAGISRALSDMGHKVYVLGKFVGDNWCSSTVHTQNINFVNIDSPHLKDNWVGETFSALLLSRRMCTNVNSIEPDLIIIPARFTGYYVSKLDYPTMFVTHNPDGMDFFRDYSVTSNELNAIYFPIKKYFEKSVIGESDIIITLNSKINECISSQDHPAVVTIPNGVNPALYTSNQEENYLLFSGGNRDIKDPDTMVEAFNKISEDIPINLRYIGSPPREIEKKIRHYGLSNRIKTMPLLEKTDFREQISSCTAFVLPSRFECMPVSLLEAMASKKVVIASDIPGPSDVIDDNINGYLFEQGNADALAKKIRTALTSDNMHEIAEKAAQTINERYTFRNIARKYDETYTQYIKGESYV